jgi:CRP-like cAMP-binding protein
MSNWDHPTILAEAQPFDGLKSEVLEALWRAGRRRSAQRGEVLFSQGDPCTHFYVLLSGTVKMVHVTEDGHEVVQGFITPGEMFACVAVAGAPVYPASAMVQAASDALSWDREAFEPIMLRHPEIGQNIMGTFGKRLQNARDRVVEFATKTSEQRIASALLRLAKGRSDRPACGAELSRSISVSRQDVAAMSGTGLYTVSRTLQCWQRAGLVQVARCRIMVLDIGGLERINAGEAAPASPGEEQSFSRR